MHTGLFLGPTFGVLGGLLMQVPVHPGGVDWQGMTGLAVGVGGIVTGLAATVAKVMENRAAIQSLHDQVERLTAQNAEQAAELKGLHRGQAELKADQRDAAAVTRREAGTAAAAVEAALSRKEDRAAP